jgi:hypothetical protein
LENVKGGGARDRLFWKEGSTVKKWRRDEEIKG